MLKPSKALTSYLFSILLQHNKLQYFKILCKIYGLKPELTEDEKKALELYKRVSIF